MDNYLVRTLAYNKQARILFVDSTKMVKEICNHKNMNKLLKTALGKTVTIASLISGTLKGDQRISLKISASNRNYKIFADADSMGNVRGYINDDLLNASLGYKDGLSIEEVIGQKGCLQVLKDLGMNGIFTGITDMPHGNIVDDFSYYFKQSEQIPSIFFITVMYNENNEIVLGRGIMAQLLPGAPIDLMDTIKRNVAENQSVISTMRNYKKIEEIPQLLFEDIEIVGIESVQFFCGCSKEFFYAMLYSLDREELVSACQKGEPIEMVCNVCGRKYSFNPEEIKGFLQ